MRDNYKIQTDYARGIFLKYDQSRLIENFHLAHDEEFLYINFVNSPYRIHRVTGYVEGQDEQGRWSESEFHEVLSIYDMICNTNGFPVLAKNWSPIGNLGGMRNASAPVGEDCFDHYGAFFSGKTEALAKACEKMGGIKAPRGDVAYYLPMFDFFPVYLRFYDADDEFPAQLQILWDTNTCQYIHYETTFYMTCVLLEKIKQYSGV